MGYLHCVPKKTCDHIFDDKFTKIFGTLITKCISHRLVYLVSHLTYFVQLLYLGKLSKPKSHEFSLKFLIFLMLQYKLQNCHHIILLTNYTTYGLFIYSLFFYIYSLIILYAVEAVQPNKSTIHMFNALVDRAVFRIFGCTSAEDIKYIRSVVNLPCIDDVLCRRRSVFIKKYVTCFAWGDVIVRCAQ